MKNRFEEILKDLEDHHYHDDLDTAPEIIKDCYAKLKCQPDPYYWTMIRLVKSLVNE